MNKRLVITEEDRRHILSMYNLITEAAETATNTQFKNNFRFEYKAGYWSVENPLNESGGKTVKQQIDDFAKEFATWYQGLVTQKFPVGQIKIVLTASESKIPNTNQEDEKKPSVGDGFLSSNRLRSLRSYLSSLFANYENVVFVEDDKGAQGPNYTGKENKEDYKQYQYVTISVDALATIPCGGEQSIRGQQQAPPNFQFNFEFVADPNAQGYTFECDAFTIPDRFGNLESFQSNAEPNLQKLFSYILGRVYEKYPNSAAFNGVFLTNTDDDLKSFNTQWESKTYKGALAKLIESIGENYIKNTIFAGESDAIKDAFVKGESFSNTDLTFNKNGFINYCFTFIYKTGLAKGITDFTKIPMYEKLNQYVINNVNYTQKFFDLLKTSDKDWKKPEFEPYARREMERIFDLNTEIKQALDSKKQGNVMDVLKRLFKYSIKITSQKQEITLTENKLPVYAPLARTVFKVKRKC